MVYDSYIKWTTKEGVVSEIYPLEIRVTLNKDAKSNSAEITLPKRPYTLDGDIVFKSGESIEIYLKNNGLIDRTNPVDDLILTTTIIDFERQAAAGIIKLICTDLTYDLLSTLFNQDIVAKPNEIVNLIIQNSALNGIDQTTVTTNIQALRSNSTEFSNVNFVSAWKTSYDCIAELAGTGNTGDTQDYIFWFEPDGTFNWIFPPQDIETLEIKHNSGIKDIKHIRSDVENIAMVIYNAGVDLNGSYTYGFAYNPYAENIKGAVRYYPMLDISTSLMKTSFASGTNEDFINEQIRQAEIQANFLIKKYSGGVDKTNCVVTGRKVNIAKLYPVESDIFPLKNLRLQRVVHTYNRNGWETKLELEEDMRN